jgi:hypothetical protein
VTLKRTSQLARIKEEAFSETRLTTIHFPAPLEVLSASSFAACPSLGFVPFAPQSRLQPIGALVFRAPLITKLAIPGSVALLSGSTFADGRLANLSF